MPSSNPQLKTYVTPEFLYGFNEAVEVSGMSKSEFVREAIRLYARDEWGIELEDDMPGRGTYERKPDNVR